MANRSGGAAARNEQREWPTLWPAKALREFYTPVLHRKRIVACGQTRKLSTRDLFRLKSLLLLNCMIKDINKRVQMI
jgi:hypothetical protein